MKPLLTHRKAIFLVLILLLAESLVGTYVFDYWANICADYRHQLEFKYNNQPKPSQSPSPCSVRKEEGPNGTKSMYIESSISISFQIEASGEYFDYSAYIEHILRLQILEKTYNFIRDVHKEIFETTVCILCFFSLILGKSKLTRRKFL
jgi:hypothetical protein